MGLILTSSTPGVYLFTGLLIVGTDERNNHGDVMGYIYIPSGYD